MTNKERCYELMGKGYLTPLEQLELIQKSGCKIGNHYIGFNYVEDELKYASKCHKLESEIDVSLETLVIGFKALKNGIYYKELGLKSHYDVRGINEKGIEVISNLCGWGECDFVLKFSDYKKTWWLREDRSK